MKFRKKLGYDNSLRTVLSDDGKAIYGISGTLEDCLNAGFFAYFDLTYVDLSTWVFIPNELLFGSAGAYYKDECYFGTTRLNAIGEWLGDMDVKSWREDYD